MPSEQNPQRRALVVDDDDTVVEHVTQVLHKMAFAVDCAVDGLDALERCHSNRFDVIICDIRMPRLSGLSFLSNLGKTLNATARVIMISGLDDNVIRNQVLSSGASMYLVKPIAAQDLRDAIGNL
jgi:DNA-binding response OmpR family regulator